jgi:hypothetical protein
MVSTVDLTDSGLDEADPQDVPLGLQLGDALELDPELTSLRGRELLDLADPALERRWSHRARGAGAADLTCCADACFLRIGIEGPMTPPRPGQIYWTFVWFADTDTNVLWTAARERRSLST